MKEDNEDNGGDKKFPIWLLGDSNPPQWEDKLDYPFDHRHPVVHNVWTSVIDVIQDRVFRFRDTEHYRIDTSRIYIRNAIQNSEDKKGIEYHIEWDNRINYEITKLSKLLITYDPKIIISFGSFSFEFIRRVVFPDIKPQPYRDWDTRKLGIEFRNSINSFDLIKKNIFPLLHRSISGGHYLKSHENFCVPEEGKIFNEEKPNYFNYVGHAIAAKVLEFRNDLDIWIK